MLLLFVLRNLFCFLLSMFSIFTPTSSIWSCWLVLFTLNLVFYLKKFFWWFIFFDVINSEGSPTYLGAIKIVNSQNSGFLVLICKKCETSRFSSLFIPDQPQIYDFSKLGKNNDYIPLIHSIVEVSYKYVSAIVLIMPGSGAFDIIPELVKLEFLNIFGGVHVINALYDFYNRIEKVQLREYIKNVIHFNIYHIITRYSNRRKVINMNLRHFSWLQLLGNSDIILKLNRIIYKIISNLMQQFTKPEKIKPKKCSKFVKTLFLMLKDEKSQIAWTNDQCYFKILNPSVFTQKILPIYFKHANLASFIRQLNLYGFKKILQRGDQDNCYGHAYFRKQEPELLVKIHRNIHQKANLFAKRTVLFSPKDCPNQIDPLLLENDLLKKKLLQQEKQLEELKTKCIGLAKKNNHLSRKLFTQNKGKQQKKKRVLFKEDFSDTFSKDIKLSPFNRSQNFTLFEQANRTPNTNVYGSQSQNSENSVSSRSQPHDFECSSHGQNDLQGSAYEDLSVLNCINYSSVQGKYHADIQYDKESQGPPE